MIAGNWLLSPPIDSDTAADVLPAVPTVVLMLVIVVVVALEDIDCDIDIMGELPDGGDNVVPPAGVGALVVGALVGVAHRSDMSLSIRKSHWRALSSD